MAGMHAGSLNMIDNYDCWQNDIYMSYIQLCILQFFHPYNFGMYDTYQHNLLGQSISRILSNNSFSILTLQNQCL